MIFLNIFIRHYYNSVCSHAITVDYTENCHNTTFYNGVYQRQDKLVNGAPGRVEN